MKRIVSAVAVVMLVVALAPAASATDARSRSLLYNLAFEDQTDIFLFPQLLPVYEGAYFHLPFNNEGGVFGGLILGMGDGALGVFVHRPLGSAFDQFRIPVTDMGLPVDLGVTGGNPSAIMAGQVSGQIFDLMYGARSWGLGLRLYLFSDISVQYFPLSDPMPGTAAFITELNAGFNFSPGFDMRFNFSLRHDEDASDVIFIRAGMRYLEPGEKRMRLVLAGELQIGILIPYNEDPEDDGASFGLSVPFKGGVRFAAIPEKLYFSLLGGVDIQMISLYPIDVGATEAADMRFGISFPTLEIAGEWYALDWLRVRSAIKGAWGIVLAGPKTPPPDEDPQHYKYEQMVFSSGVGFPLGAFCLDAVIQYSLWNNGPDFIGGAGGGMFAGVSLSYRWGDGAPGPSGGFSAESGEGWSTPRGESKPVIKPKPEPKPKPAPPPPEAKPAPAEEKPEEAAPKEKKKEGSFEGWEEE